MPRSLETLASYYESLAEKDPNLAYAAVLLNSADKIIKEAEESGKIPTLKNPAAIEFGRKGGKIGGLARAAKLTPERRSEIATNAVKQREANRAARRQANP